MSSPRSRTTPKHKKNVITHRLKMHTHHIVSEAWLQTFTISHPNPRHRTNIKNWGFAIGADCSFPIRSYWSGALTTQRHTIVNSLTSEHKRGTINHQSTMVQIHARHILLESMAPIAENLASTPFEQNKH